MRICSLTLLSVLFLAAHRVSAKIKNEVRSGQNDEPDRNSSIPLGKPPMKQRSRTSKSATCGKFIAKNQAACKWTVAEQVPGVTLQVDCTQIEHNFSCVFSGKPATCLQLHSQLYWKQVARALRKQKQLCEDSRSVLKTKVCRKQFPESNLKLVNSTLTGNMKSRKETRERSHQERVEVKGTASTEPSKATEDSHPSSTVTQPTPTKGLECAEDPDMVNQKKVALQLCGEAWSSLCTFLLYMIQDKSC
ncbi:fibroblast growth factor-binding protein 1 [Ochotona curzoniae]|uniref:fibroblast growth factor-binding protein 1 n=1 Tax=Ochotona curzoniae TaxID=130825 RepID=UPI001B352899|nr:fibroblast growth factor-binding protein 1 [Ochotona curzoniae]